MVGHLVGQHAAMQLVEERIIVPELSSPIHPHAPLSLEVNEFVS